MKIRIDGKEVEIKAEDIVEITVAEIPATVVKEIGGLNDTKVKDYLATKEGKALIQPVVDSAVTKGIDTFTTNNKEKFKKEGYDTAKSELATELEEQNSKMKDIQIGSKLQKQLLMRGINPEKIDLAMKLIDKSKISLDGENLLGSAEILDGLQEQTKEWFEATPSPKGKGTTTVPPAGGVPAGEPSGKTDFEINFEKALGL